MKCKSCQREVRIKSRGMCSTCYERNRKNGELEKPDNDKLNNYTCKNCGKNFSSYKKQRKYCSRKCYELSERVFTRNQELQIIGLYNDGISATKISKLYNVSHTTIIELLDRDGINHREKWSYSKRYELNENYFDIIDTQDKAYWLGFIYADGYVRTGELSINLKSSDVGHLEKLREFIGSSHLIKSQIKFGNNTQRISFPNKHMANRLANLGIIPRRGEFNRTLNELPESLYTHFIRGILDGDGYITKIDTKYTRNIGFLGQDDILIWIKHTIEKNCSGIGDPQIKQRRGIKEISFGGKYQVTFILNWLYKDATVFLQRKHERAIYWMG